MRCWFFSQNVSSALFFLSLLTCGEVYIIVKKERLLSTNSQEVIFSAHESNRIQPVKISFECIDTRLKSFLSSNLLSLRLTLLGSMIYNVLCSDSPASQNNASNGTKTMKKKFCSVYTSRPMNLPKIHMPSYSGHTIYLFPDIFIPDK